MRTSDPVACPLISLKAQANTTCRVHLRVCVPLRRPLLTAASERESEDCAAAALQRPQKASDRQTLPPAAMPRTASLSLPRPLALALLAAFAAVSVSGHRVIQVRRRPSLRFCRLRFPISVSTVGLSQPAVVCLCVDFCCCKRVCLCSQGALTDNPPPHLPTHTHAHPADGVRTRRRGATGVL